jgi:hypothetical protein
MPRRFRFHDGRSGAAVTVHVTPRARKTEITGILPDNTLRIRLAAPPVEGAANKALLEFLAKVLGVRESNLEILAGEKGRDKIISVVDLDTAAADERIRKHIKESSAD